MLTQDTYSASGGDTGDVSDDVISCCLGDVAAVVIDGQEVVIFVLHLPGQVDWTDNDECGCTIDIMVSKLTTVI